MAKRATKSVKRGLRKPVNEAILDTAAVEAAVRRGARDALLRHKRAGVPVAAWRNGKVVLIAPAKIRIPPVPSR